MCYVMLCCSWQVHYSQTCLWSCRLLQARAMKHITSHADHVFCLVQEEEVDINKGVTKSQILQKEWATLLSAAWPEALVVHLEVKQPIHYGISFELTAALVAAKSCNAPCLIKNCMFVKYLRHISTLAGLPVRTYVRSVVTVCSPPSSCESCILPSSPDLLDLCPDLLDLCVCEAYEFLTFHRTLAI